MYNDLVELEGINSQFLSVITLKKKETGFIIDTGAIYKKDVALNIVSIKVDGVSLVRETTASLSSGEFYFDQFTLYLRLPDDSNPNTKFVVIYHELYFSTFDAHFPRIPTEDEDVFNIPVYFEPQIEKSPVLKISNNDLLFGFIPDQRSQMILSNAEHNLEPYLIVNSFLNAEIKLYHWLDELEKDNIKLVFSGFISDVKWEGSRVTLETFEQFLFLQNEFRSEGDAFYALSEFPNLDPSFQTRPIPTVYGLVDQMIPVNVSYVKDNPTTSDNRTWSVLKGQGSTEKTFIVVASPTSTTTRTYLTATKGITIGDTLFFNKALNEYREVDFVDYVNDFIEHSALSAACVATDILRRGVISKVTIRQGNRNVTGMYHRDYTVNTSLAQNTTGILFSTSLESNLSMPETLSVNDSVACRVYGEQNSVTLGGNPFGADDDKTDNLRECVVIIFDILKKLGISESEINLASFTQALADVSCPVGFRLPLKNGQNFPKAKDLLIDLLKTGLLRFFLDSNRKWAIKPIKKFGPTSEYVLEDDEILRGSVVADISYNDLLSTVNVEYALRDVTNPNFGQQDTGDLVSVSSDKAKFLHEITKSKTFDALFADCDTDEALEYAEKLSDIFSEPQVRFTFRVKNRFFNTNIGDQILMSRTALPSFEFDEDFLNDQKMSVTEVQRGLESVTLSCDTQIGIQESSVF